MCYVYIQLAVRASWKTAHINTYTTVQPPHDVTLGVMHDNDKPLNVPCIVCASEDLSSIHQQFDKCELQSICSGGQQCTDPACNLCVLNLKPVGSEHAPVMVLAKHHLKRRTTQPQPDNLAECNAVHTPVHKAM